MFMTKGGCYKSRFEFGRRAKQMQILQVRFTNQAGTEEVGDDEQKIVSLSLFLQYSAEYKN
jgi:hypothetical protein